MNKSDLTEIDVPLARTGAQEKALQEIVVMKTIATMLLTQSAVRVFHPDDLSETARNYLFEKGYSVRYTPLADIHVYPNDWEMGICGPHPPGQKSCCVIL